MIEFEANVLEAELRKGVRSGLIEFKVLTDCQAPRRHIGEGQKAQHLSFPLFTL